MRSPAVAWPTERPPAAPPSPSAPPPSRKPGSKLLQLELSPDDARSPPPTYCPTDVTGLEIGLPVTSGHAGKVARPFSPRARETARMRKVFPFSPTPLIVCRCPKFDPI